MHYLIDGHNLIGAMADISLDDPDDEARLVMQLRSWAAAARQRRVTVIFDSGQPGGLERQLSRGHLKVIFAPPGRTADDLLISRARRVQPPQAYAMVSSDRQVRAAALARKMRVYTAAEFAQKLAEHRTAPQPAQPLQASAEPLLSEAEVDEWLAVFGPPPEKAATSADRTVREPSPGPEKAQGARETVEPEQLKSGRRRMSPEELADWLAMFEGQEEK
jgi:uncharacterized protein